MPTRSHLRHYLFPFLITCISLGVKAQCSLSISMADTINACGQPSVALSPVVTGLPAFTDVIWSPAAGLSGTSTLNTTATVGSTPQQYNLSVYGPVSGNAVSNPAFTGGNTGFNSAYTYSTTVNAPGRYLMMTNPSVLGPNWPNPGDHTTGTGLMMVVDGATVPNTSFWCQSISVVPNTYYELSAWTVLAYPPAAQLKFAINGMQVGDIYPVVNNNVWSQYKAVWYSGSAVTASICITDTNTVLNGNDFYIDDIAFHELCMAKDSIVIIPAATAVPAIAITVLPNDTVCANTELNFSAVYTNGGTAPQLQWYRNGNPIPGATLATFATTNFSSGDYFSCELVSNAPCAVTTPQMSNVIPITVLPLVPAQVSITASPGLQLSPWQMVTFTATPVNGGTAPQYQWLRNNQPVIGAVSDTWGANNLDNGDAIDVIMTSSDLCAFPQKDTSNRMIVSIKTGISMLNSSSGITIYPNPGNGNFMIEGYLEHKNADLEVIDAVGRVVHTAHLGLDNNKIKYEMKLNVANGHYLLRLRSGDEEQTVKFTVSGK